MFKAKHRRGDRFPRALFALLLVGSVAPHIRGQEADSESNPVLALETGGHTAPIRRAVFTPDGHELITVSLDKTIRFWDLGTGLARVVRPPVGPGAQGELHTAALSPDGKILAVAGFGYFRLKQHLSPIFLIDRVSGAIQHMLPGHTGLVNTLAFSADGKYLASGGQDLRILIWDVAAATVAKTLRGHTGSITGLAFSPDGKKLVSAGSPPRLGDVSREGVAWIWSVETENVLTRLAGAHERPVRHVAWSNDGQSIATGSQEDTNPADNFVALWDTDGKLRKKINYVSYRRMTCTSLSFTPNSQNLVIALRDQFYVNTGIYPLTGGEAVLFCSNNVHEVELPAGAAVLSPDGSRLAVIDDRHHRATVYDRKAGRVVRTTDRIAAIAVPAERTLGGAGRQPTLVSWVRTDDPNRRMLAWRTQLLGQNYRPWEPLPAGLFEHVFLLDALEIDTARAVPQERYVRTRLREGPLELYSILGPEVFLRRNEEVLAKLRPRGVSWMTAPAVSFLSPDRAVIANKTGLFLFDTGPLGMGQRLHTFGGPNGPVLSVSPSPDQGRYLLASADDQVMRIWDSRRTQPLLSLFVAGGDWICWTEEGYYAASPGGERLMGWTVNNGPDRIASFYPAGRFHKQLFRPDVIKLVLEKGSLKEALAAANAALTDAGAKGVADLKQLLPPKADVHILETKEPMVKVKASARATVPTQPVIALRLFVDGLPLRDAGAADFKPGKATAEVEWHIQLPPGKHSLSVLARSPDASAVSEAVEVSFIKKADQPVLHVLAVGVSKYNDKALRLNFAARDAEELGAGFQKANMGNLFGAVQAQQLLDEHAQRAAVLDKLKKLRATVKANDRVVFYFAGHGVKDKDNFYLLPVEADLTDLATTAISGADLRHALSEFPCQVLLMLDACHATTGIKNFRRAVDDLTRTLTDDECGVAVMCAAMSHEIAQEKNGHGLFTHAVLDALKGGSNVPRHARTGRFYVHHLQSFVFDRVSDESGDRQHPFLNLPWIVESFPVAQFAK